MQMAGEKEVCIIGLDASVLCGGGGLTADRLRLTMRLSGKCCETQDRPRLRVDVAFGLIDATDDGGIEVIKQHIINRVSDHFTEKSCGAKCLLNFHPQRDTCAVPYIVQNLVCCESTNTNSPAPKRDHEGNKKKDDLKWTDGSGYNERKLKSKHLAKLLPVLHKIVRGRGTAGAIADKAKVRALFQAVGHESHLNFKVRDYTTDDTVKSEIRKLEAHYRARKMIDTLRCTKPTADQLTTLGTYIACTAPEEFADDATWKGFSQDLGYKDVRKVKHAWDACKLRFAHDRYFEGNCVMYYLFFFKRFLFFFNIATPIPLVPKIPP